MALPTNINNILNSNIVEDVRVEYKKGWNPETTLKTICAFSNDIDNFYGGYIVIGLEEENGVPKRPAYGLDEKNIDAIEKDIIEYCKKCIKPSYIPLIDVVELDNKKLIVLWCTTGPDRPYKCYESVHSAKKDTRELIYIRKGSTTIVASQEDEKELYGLTSREPYDDRINYQTKIDDLDKSLVQSYLKEIGSNLYLKSGSMEMIDLLKDLRVVDGPKENLRPKNIALLMFTNNPEKYIPYSYIDFTIIDEPEGNGMVEMKFTGPLNKQFESVMNFIKTNIIKAVTFKKDGEYKSTKIYNYSFEALEEVIANALLHKSYQEYEPVTIRIENDHIEVTSIPGFDRTISNTAIKELKPKSKRYRNRRIAEFFKELGLAEAKNTGYPEILKKCMENSSPLPVIDTNEERDYVTVVIPIHEHFNPKKFTLEEKIIDALNLAPMTKTELCKYLGYERVVNSVTVKLNKLISEEKVTVSNKVYQLK